MTPLWMARDWEPPLWAAFALALVFAVIVSVGFFMAMDPRALAVPSILFTVCFRTAYKSTLRRDRPADPHHPLPSGDEALDKALAAVAIEAKETAAV